MTKTIAAGAIQLYQRHLSPRKGYGCPRRVLRGRMSCAEFARRAVLRVGPVRALSLMRRRFRQCAVARRAAAADAPDGEQGPATSGEPRPLDYATPAPARTDGWRWRGCGKSLWCDESDVTSCLCSFAPNCCSPP